MNRFLRIIFKTLKITAGVLLLLYIIVFAYVSINKKSIILQVNEEISSKLSGQVSISDIELSFFRHFPSVAVVLNEVTIRDSLYNQHRHTFFEAKHVFIRLSILKLLQKKPPLTGVRIERGKVYLYIATDGYSNKYLLDQKNKNAAGTPASEKSALTSIKLDDVNIIIDDKQKEKFHHLSVNSLVVKLDDKADRIEFDSRANILIHGLGFNLSRGSFLHEKLFRSDFSMQFLKATHQLQFNDISTKLDEERFTLSGMFDLSGEKPQFGLDITSKGIGYEVAKSMLTERISRSLSLVSLDKPISVHAKINGPLKGGEPLILINWTAAGTKLTSPFMDFTNASFSGFFTNEVVKGIPRYDPNSVIRLDNFTATWHDLPLSSKKIEILNLEDPLLSCDLSSNFPLVKLNNLLGSSVIQLTDGNCAVNIQYKGPIVRNNNTNSFINGTVSFSNGNIQYLPRDVQMKNVQGQLVINNSDVFVKNLQCNVLNNAIMMQGYGKNLLSLMNTEPAKAYIDWNISSPNLNLGSFMFLLKPGKSARQSKNSKQNVKPFAATIDAVLEQASFHVKLKVNSLAYKKFNASNVEADISVLEDRYMINQVSMVHSGGSLSLNGSLLKQKSNRLEAKINANLRNMDVASVFRAFDNFGQDGIEAQNLEGKLTATVFANLAMDENATIYPSSLQSDINFSLKEGALNNFEPVKKMQNIIFKKRDFENIRFAELKNRLEISNRDIKINRMEIQSSVFTFFVEGMYSLKGNTDISIQVPLNNLKKRNADYNPINAGTDKKGGKSIFLRGRPGTDGKINFKIDLLNKFKKEKEKEATQDNN